MPIEAFTIAKENFIELIPELQKEMLAITGGDGGFCYSASEVCRRIFRYLDIDCKIIFVRGVIENKICKDVRKRYEITDPQFLTTLLKEGGWNAGVGLGNDSNGNPNFHAVLYFPNEREILDMTLFQMSQPQHDMKLPAYFFGVSEEYFAIYSDGFPKALFESPKLRASFKPCVENDIRFSQLADLYSIKLGAKVTYGV